MKLNSEEAPMWRKRLYALVVIIVSLPSLAGAAMDASMYSVEVVTKSSGTLRGYLILPMIGPLHAASPNPLTYIRTRNYRLWFYQSIELTAKMSRYYGPFKITTKEPLQIPPMDFKSMKQLDWSLNEKEFGDRPAVVSKEQAGLLKQPPLAFCPSKIWDCDYWISYNPSVDEKALDSLCNRKFESRPSDEEQKTMLKKGRVVHLSFFCD